MPSSHDRGRSGRARRTPGGLGGVTPAEAASGPVPQEATVVLHIELQEGWLDDPVEIHANGVLVARLAQARTKPQTGLAEMVETEVPAGETTVRVELTSRGIAGEHRVTLATEHWVGVSVTEAGLRFRDQGHLFGYV